MIKRPSITDLATIEAAQTGRIMEPEAYGQTIEGEGVIRHTRQSW